MNDLIYRKDKDLDPHIIYCWEKALSAYPELWNNRLYLHSRNLRDMTMRAQPVVNALFFFKKWRRYRVDVQGYTQVNETISLRELPEAVLVGWFAHELGHVMDYLPRSGWNLAAFGIQYWYSPTFTIGAERKADLIAIEHGFAEEITATKRFLLEESSIPNTYKDRLEKYYMSIEEVERVVMKKQESEVHRDRIFG